MNWEPEHEQEALAADADLAKDQYHDEKAAAEAEGLAAEEQQPAGEGEE